ncbi:FimV/HubP family polar landmark protein [Vibrio maritimus]|uniref:FimV/HubP family polar landmark protein n=1 Tax=Vibrio maritimus TaxID=990268 RepID=UPI0040695E42
MHHFLKPLLVTLALAGATTPFSISADTIRLTGPNGEVISAPQYSQPVRQAVPSESDSPARYYGPTGPNETLWSIASRFKPANASVQQTIYAFYELNPGQFEQNNIHQLAPGSELRIPSNELINRVDLQEALAVLSAHQNKLNQSVAPAAVPRPERAITPSPSVVEPSVVEPPKVADKTPVPTQPVVKETPTTEVAKSKPSEPKPAASGTTKAEPDATQALREELSRSESELLSLEERNHQLRLMLSEVQNEVEVLKTEVDNEERIRSEVERQLSEEKRKQAELARLAPSQLDVWLAKPWFVALLASIPALLVGLLVMMIMRSRKRSDEPAVSKAVEDNQTASNNSPDAAGAAAMGGAALAAGAVAADDEEDLFSDDLLAGLEEEDSTDEEPKEDAEPDVFADLDESDFDFNLDDDEDPFASIDDDGELDIGVVDLDASNNGISVKNGEKALGLEEMERALNDVAVPGDDVDDLDLDLSDEDDSDEVVSQDDLDSLFANFSLDSDTESNKDPIDDEDNSALDQAQMDELLAGDDFDLDEGDIDLDDLSADSPLASLDKLIAEDSNSTDSVAEDSNVPDLNTADIDASFDLDSPNEASESVGNDDIDDLFAQFSQIDSTPESTTDTDAQTADATDVDLLDEMLEDDFELSDLDDSDLMLDEVLSAEDAQSQSNDDEVHLLADEDDNLDESSTDLLDEVLFESNLASSTQDELDDDFDLDPFSADSLLGSDIADDDTTVSSVETVLDQQEDELDLDDIDALLAENSLDSSSQDASELEASDDIVADESSAVEELSQAASETVSEVEAFDAPQQQSNEEHHELEVDLEDTAVSEDDIDALLNEVSAQQAEEKAVPESVDVDLTAAEADPEVETVDEVALDAHQSLEESSLEFDAEQDSVAPQALSEPTSDSSADFEFAPEIEGASNLTHEEDNTEQARKELDALVANEFGVPSDDDWLVDDEESASSDTETVLAESESFESQATEPVESAVPPTETELDDADFLANALQSEYGEEQAFADAEGEGEDLPMSEDSADGEFAFADDELPEYSEEDAIADSVQSAEEQVPVVETFSEDEAPALEQEPTPIQNDLPEPDNELVDEDFEFPEFTEEDALSEVAHEPSEDLEPLAVGEDSRELEEISLESIPEYDEQQAAMDYAGDDTETVDSAEGSDIPEPSFAPQEMVGETLDHSEIDALADAFNMVDMSAIEQEGNLNELLKDGDNAAFSNISPVDQTTADSAGLDIEAMLQDAPTSDAGEDWNGFTLTDDQRAAINSDIPAEEQAIWNDNDAGSLAKAADEDWSSQDPDSDFDATDSQFMTIDELMAQVQDGEESDKDEEELKLDVGLDEFPDVIGPISDVDVDSDSEAAGNLDMAKIYIEMNDYEGAIKLLEKVLLEGSGQIEDEAKRLLSKLSEYQ